MRAEQGGSTAGTIDAEVRALQRAPDVGSFEIAPLSLRENVARRAGGIWQRSGPNGGPNIRARVGQQQHEGTASCEDCRALDDILQLTDIPRPVVGLCPFELAHWQFRPLDVQPIAALLEKVLDQLGNVVAAVAKRRRRNGEDSQPVEQVQAETVFDHLLLKVAIGGGNDPNVDAAGRLIPQSFELPFLKNPQQLAMCAIFSGASTGTR